MPKCSKCGANIKEGNSFCSKCGNKLEAQPQKTQASPQQSTPSSATAPKKKKSTGVKILLGCLIAFVAFLIVGGVVGYFLVKKGIEKAQEEIDKVEEGWQEGVEGWEELENVGEEMEKKQQEFEDEWEDNLEDEANDDSDSSSSTKTKEDEPTQKASEVVEEFMACTLGTIPQKCPSDNKDSVAKDHLTLEMRADYNSGGFVPLNYCIQDGPNDVRIDSETETGNFAYVMVSAKYGTDDFTPFWNFVLIVQDGEWKIKEIQCLNF